MDVSPLEHIIRFGAAGSWNQGVGPNNDSFGKRQTEANWMLMSETGQPGKRHRCEKCGKTYTWKQGLLDHVRFVCGKDPQFHCDFCNYKTHRKGNLNRHIFLLHKVPPCMK